MKRHKDLQGCKTNGGKLAHWSPLLKNWSMLINRYCRAWGGEDVPYYYNERANISILSASVWRAGWTALEEFGSRKRGKKNGRSDLYMWDPKRAMGEYVEAKQEWKITKAKNIISEAMKDARKLILNKSYLNEDLFIGVAFIVPWINLKFKPTIDNEINQIIENAIAIYNEINCDALAWTFPSNSRFASWQGEPNRLYPGVLLFAKAIN
jgi:hypothetical protein